MSGLVFAAIAPHGHHAIPEALPPEDRHLGQTTQASMQELGRQFAAAQPDVSIILTPHNVHIEQQMAVLMAGKLHGTLSDWTTAPISLDATTDRTLGRAILDGLNAAGVPATGVSYGGNDQATATAIMDWGVLIPLWFMGGRATPPVPTVVVCPARDRSLDDHLTAGKVLADVAVASGKRVALIASCDHGHGHLASGPYGFDPTSAVYDQQVVELIKANDLGKLRDYEVSFVNQAKADSFWQMLMLHGAIGNNWAVEFLSYEVPTYFGMICAAFRPA